MLYLIPFICLLVVPIVGYLTFLWLNSEINSLLAGYGVTAKEFCNSYTDSQIQSMCAEIYPIFWLGDASLYSGIASLLFLGLIIVSSSFASPTIIIVQIV